MVRILTCMPHLESAAMLLTTIASITVSGVSSSTASGLFGHPKILCMVWFI